MKANLKILFTIALLCGTLTFVQAQINLGKIKDKVGGKKETKKEEAKKEEVRKEATIIQTNSNNITQNNTQTSPKKEELDALITKLKKENKISILSKSGTDPMKTMAEIPAYLTFTNDFNAPNKDISEFTSKDFIYARFHLPKSILDYLLKPDDSSLEYYRFKVIAKANGYEEENNHRVEKNSYCQDAYKSNDLLIAVVPEKLFFENITFAYQKDEKFPNATQERASYQNVLARNTSRQVAQLLKDLPEGEHIVEINFEVTAKQRGSDFMQLTGAKGYFLVNLDAEAKERYAQVYEMLTELYQSYKDKESIAGQQISDEKEAEMLKNMSPRDQERYKIAKNSPEGYMAAYKGQKASCTFVMDNVRNKTAHIEVLWEDGGEGKEAGRHGFFIGTTGRSKTKNIPIGAKVSINGRVLIPSVSGNQTVTIYWWY
ncbi:MAG: hypothetical protein OHK0057_08930 [Thermoflexibacter sp.]